jgi:hypothetical protein
MDLSSDWLGLFIYRPTPQELSIPDVSFHRATEFEFIIRTALFWKKLVRCKGSQNSAREYSNQNLAQCLLFRWSNLLILRLRMVGFFLLYLVSLSRKNR